MQTLPFKLRGLYLNRDGANGSALPDFNRGGLNRTMEVASVDEAKRTVELAFSSEIEVERWFGIEILDHDATSVDLSRLENGGAVLVDHDWADQVGVVESVRIDADRRGRAVVRFGRSARATEIFQDIVDGIRRHVSVGYRIHDAVRVETRDGVDVYKMTRWEPYEISMVSVPADPSVGIGRSLENPQEEPGRRQQQTAPNGIGQNGEPNKETRNMKIKVLRDASGNLVRARVDDNDNIVEVLETLEAAGEAERSAARAAEQAIQRRNASILDMGDRYNCVDLARQAIKEGKTEEEFRAMALDHINSRGGRSTQTNTDNGQRSGNRPVSENNGNNIGLTDGEVRNYSLMRVVRALSNPNDARAQQAAAFEFECSRAAEQATGRTPQGILIPQDVLASRAFNAGGAADTPAGAQTGNVAVDTTFLGGSFIDMLRNRTVLMGLGTTMAGLTGNVDIPRQTGGATAYWIGENQDASEGSPSLGQLSMTPKTVAAYTEITRRLMMQASLDVEGIVRRDLTNAIAQAIDYAGFYGTGTDNQPRGLKNYTGINSVGFASNPTYAQLVQMESEIAADNADVNGMAYIFNAKMRGYLKTTPKFGSGTEATIWEQGNTVNGYRTGVTNQLADNDVFFGNFADFIIGMWGGLDLKVDPYSNSKNGSVRLVVFQDVDFLLRRVESICYK